MSEINSQLRYLPSPEASQMFMDYVMERYNNPDKSYGYRTGIADLDNVFFEFERGWMCVVGAPPKGGKTAFLTTLKREFYKQGAKILDISLEMGTIGTMSRLFSNVSGVSMTKTRNTKLLTELDIEKLESAKLNISDGAVCFNTGAGGVAQIGALVEELDPDVIIIDYLQLMRSSGARGRTEEIEKISRELKQLTTDFGRPRLLFVASQFSREANKSGAFSNPYGFKGSGGIENDADMAITIAPIEDVNGNVEKNMKEVRVVISRWTEAGMSFPVYFSGAMARVRSMVTVDQIQRQDDMQLTSQIFEQATLYLPQYEYEM